MQHKYPRLQANELEQIECQLFEDLADLDPSLAKAILHQLGPQLPKKIPRRYSQLVQMCLEKQLAQHSKYLFNFNQVFAEVDRDRDGQLSQDEFSELIKKMDIGVSGEQAQELYYQMQKSYAVGEGLVQYSQIIQVLSTEEAGLNGLRK